MWAAPDPVKTNSCNLSILKIGSDGFLEEFCCLEVVNLLVIDDKAFIERDRAEKTPILHYFIF